MSELKAYRLWPDEVRPGVNLGNDYYLKYEADKVIAKKDEEIAELKAKLGAVNEFVKESKELLKESQRMHQRCADNASKQIRRLKRALYKACANWAHHRVFVRFNANEKAWENMERKCLKKAEEYK